MCVCVCVCACVCVRSLFRRCLLVFVGLCVFILVGGPVLERCSCLCLVIAFGIPSFLYARLGL